jgi:MFS family permease
LADSIPHKIGQAKDGLIVNNHPFLYDTRMEPQPTHIRGMLTLYKGLPKPIYVLFFATIINGVGIFVYPFLVLYLTQHLGYSDAWTGAFMSLASLAYLPGSIIGGKLADRIGRKKVMLIGQSFGSLMFLICGFLGKTPLIPIFILFNLFFDGATDPARSALQTDVTNQENRQSSFSLMYLGHNLGFSVGPLIAGFLFYRAPQWLFFGNAILGFASVLFVMLRVPESRPDAQAIEASFLSNSTEKAHRGNLIKALLSRPQLLILAISATFFSFAYSQSLFALPLYTARLYGEQGATLYGTMMSLNALVVVFCTAPMVILMRKRHPLQNIALAGVLFAIGFACM